MALCRAHEREPDARVARRALDDGRAWPDEAGGLGGAVGFYNAGAQAGAPSAGWLFKEGGRKRALALAGWRRRWWLSSPSCAAG